MSKAVCLGLSILELNKILMYEFWYDYLKPKYGESVKLCYMDTNSFIVYMGKIKNVIELMKRLIRWKNYENIYWTKSKNL